MGSILFLRVKPQILTRKVMKRSNKFISIILGLVAVGTTTTSCEQFLTEESYGSTTDVFEEEAGIKALYYLSYQKLCNLYGGEWWPKMTEQGTDLFLRGNSQTNTGLADYSGLDANNGDVASLWNHCYKALANINMFLEQIDDTPFRDESEKEQIKDEIRVMRAMFLWVITETWGDSYLPMSTDKEEGLEARRSPKEDFYKEIISLLEGAISNGNIPDKRNDAADAGKIDMPTVKAFLARIYLYHQDFDKAIDMASQVIDNPSYGFKLSSSLTDLWADDKTNDEFIWTTNFSSDQSSSSGSSYWQWYAMNIDKIPGLKTELQWTGKGGCKAIPTTYYMSLFDKEADLRWRELHQTVWYYNDPADQFNFADNQKRVHVDTALVLYPETASDAQRDYASTRYNFYDINDMYNEDGTPKNRETFIGMSKFYDHTRPGDMSTFSDRSYPIIRLAELYLIRAEANIRKDNPNLTAAAEDIMTLREARCIRQNGTPEQNEAWRQAMTVTESDMNVDFIISERARELGGEWQRWLDLNRFDILVERVKLYNPDAAGNIDEHHKLRPIPQVQFDGMPDWTTLGQNPGY